MAQIEQALQDAGITFAQLIQVVLVLCGNGTLTAVQDDTAITKAKKHTDKLNTHLMMKARSSNDITFLASPVTGGGVMIGRFQQLFVASIATDKKHPSDWAQAAWQVLSAQNQKLVKEGSTLESAEDNLAELTAQANTFAEKQLPLLKALLVV
jgi:hypothetical protein